MFFIRNKKMVFIKKALLILIICVMLIELVSCGAFDAIESIEYVEIGIPLADRYDKGARARCVWDMAVYDGKLYVGTGDYSSNTGPVDIWSYDLSARAWSNSGSVEDEEISRFCFISGALVAPGIDPQESWELGNYYRLTDSEWEKVRNIPNGVHTFDMVEYDGLIFAGLGVEAGNSPIVCSDDGGKSFFEVDMQKKGVSFDGTGFEIIRVYDFFVFEGELYATLFCEAEERVYDLYRYEDGIFVYENSWDGKIKQRKYISNIIGAKSEFDGKLFFATGNLYVTDDMEKLTAITFPKLEMVCDLCVVDGSLFALCAQKLEDGGYRISVWENNGGRASGFLEIFNFVYSVPPISMVCYEGDFYIGTGDIREANEKNGMVLFIDYSEAKK